MAERPKGRLGEGCWFCLYTDDEMWFDREFDTPVHPECILKELEFNPGHEEARLMLYLFDDVETSRVKHVRRLVKSQEELEERQANQLGNRMKFRWEQVSYWFKGLWSKYARRSSRAQHPLEGPEPPIF